MVKYIYYDITNPENMKPRKYIHHKKKTTGSKTSTILCVLRNSKDFFKKKCKLKGNNLCTQKRNTVYGCPI